MNGPSRAAARAAAVYDGNTVDELRRALGVPALHVYDEAPSTMDLAHDAAAAGAPAGTVVVADVQTAGRGRSGRPWTSRAGAGVWATVVERPADVAAVAVLSLRVGLELADALDAFVRRPAATDGVRLKWPNDLLVSGRKLAGILVEARWREGAPEWVAVGVGVNHDPPPELPDAIGVGVDVPRAAVLAAVVGAVRRAAACCGQLSAAELARYARRDAVWGREVVRPVAGRAAGVAATGELLVRGHDGTPHAIPTASVEYAPTAAWRPERDAPGETQVSGNQRLSASEPTSIEA